MATGTYIGVDEIAKNVKGGYVGVDNVARKIIYGYIGVDGVARKFMQSGVEWTKYSCTTDTTYDYVQTDKGVGTTLGGNAWYSVGFQINAHSGYDFSSDRGFYGTGGIGRVTATEAIGYYEVQDTDVYTIDNVEETVHNGKDQWCIYKTRVAAANRYSYTYYTKGTTNYGTVYAKKGALPEEGTCVSGSANGAYCVLKINGILYYYVKG